MQTHRVRAPGVGARVGTAEGDAACFSPACPFWTFDASKWHIPSCDTQASPPPTSHGSGREENATCLGPGTCSPRESRREGRKAPGPNPPCLPARTPLAARPLPIARGPASCLAPRRPGLGPAQSGRARAPPPRERHRGRARASREPRRSGRGLETRRAPLPSAQRPSPGPAAAAGRSQDTLHARDPRPRVNFIRLGEIRLTGRLQRAEINLTCPPRQSRQSRRRRASWQLIGSRHCTPAPPSWA